MKLIYRKLLPGFCGAGVVVGGAVAYLRTQQSDNGAAAVVELSATEFNALQDAKRIKAALQVKHLPWSFHIRSAKESALDPLAPSAAASADHKLVLYRLLGCPYCAKVEAVLQYHDVPYEEVQVDPINGGGLPDPRYRLAPQLYLVPLTSPEAAVPAASLKTHKDGVYCVDSSAIVTELAAPLGYRKELTDPRVAGTREWISNRFQSASFVITSGSLRSAYAAYTYITPPNYQGLFHHVIGSIALYGLANYKIKPKVLAQSHAFNEAYLQSSTSSPVSAAAEGKPKTTKPEKRREETQSAEAWLQDELDVFLSRRKSDGSIFHGGSRPDLADVEMYGVSRVVSQHPSLGRVVKSGEFGKWEKAMEEVIASRRNGRP